jgi:hypothetical protein
MAKKKSSLFSSFDFSSLEAAQEKAKAAAQRVYQLAMKKTLKPLLAQRANLHDALQTVEAAIHRITGTDSAPPAKSKRMKRGKVTKKPKASSGKKEPRIRRSGDALRVIGKELYDFIKAGGKEGVSGGDLQKHLKAKHGNFKIPSPIGDWFDEKVGKGKVKSNGQVGTRAVYHAT